MPCRCDHASVVTCVVNAVHSVSNTVSSSSLLGKISVMVLLCHLSERGFFFDILDCALGGFPLHFPFGCKEACV